MTFNMWDPEYWKPILNGGFAYFTDRLKRRAETSMSISELESKVRDLQRQLDRQYFEMRDQQNQLNEQIELNQQLQVQNQQMMQVMMQIIVAAITSQRGIVQLPGDRIGIDPTVPEIQRPRVIAELETELPPDQSSRFIQQFASKPSPPAALSRSGSVQAQFRSALELCGRPPEVVQRVLRNLSKRDYSCVKISVRNSAGQRISELSISVDWAKHDQIILDSPILEAASLTWHEGVSPEIRQTATSLRTLAKVRGRSVALSFTFSPTVRRRTVRVKEAQHRLGPEATAPKPAPWASAPVEHQYRIIELAELTLVTRRVISAF